MLNNSSTELHLLDFPNSPEKMIDTTRCHSVCDAAIQFAVAVGETELEVEAKYVQWGSQLYRESGLVVSVLIDVDVATCVKSLMIDSATKLHLLDFPNSPDKIQCFLEDLRTKYPTHINGLYDACVRGVDRSRHAGG